MKRLSLAQVGGVLEGILAALAHAETAGIVHRDLKPENVMVTADGRVKITDFGIARATQRAGTHYVTATGMTVGTPTYMAPEQAMAGEVGPWTDLYSVGVLTYELILGRPPFSDSDTPVAILMRHVNEPIPSAVDARAYRRPRPVPVDRLAPGQGPAAAGSARAGRLGVARGDHRPSARAALAARGPVAGRPRGRRRGGSAHAGAVREPRLDRDADAAAPEVAGGVHHVRSGGRRGRWRRSPRLPNVIEPGARARAGEPDPEPVAESGARDRRCWPSAGAGCRSRWRWRNRSRCAKPEPEPDPEPVSEPDTAPLPEPEPEPEPPTRPPAARRATRSTTAPARVIVAGPDRGVAAAVGFILAPGSGSAPTPAGSR